MGEPDSLWSYRCICGKGFTDTYASSGLAYCPRVRCQLVCTAIEPVALIAARDEAALAGGDAPVKRTEVPQ